MHIDVLPDTLVSKECKLFINFPQMKNGSLQYSLVAPKKVIFLIWTLLRMIWITSQFLADLARNQNLVQTKIYLKYWTLKRYHKLGLRHLLCTCNMRGASSSKSSTMMTIADHLDIRSLSISLSNLDWRLELKIRYNK